MLNGADFNKLLVKMEYLDMKNILRCLVTNNPCGTDTWIPGKPCQCENCKNAPLYPCDDCGKLLSQNEGGTIFTVCEKCWDKHYSLRKKQC